jgi:hypothetical protein
MPKGRDPRVEKLMGVLAKLPDQTPQGRNRAYRQLRLAVVDDLMRLKGTAPHLITNVRQELEGILRQTEDLVAANGGAERAFRSLSASDANEVVAMADQIRLLEQTEQLTDDKGPQYGVDENGRLAMLHQVAPASEIERQRPLHRRVEKTARETLQVIQRAENQYPEIVLVVREYCEALRGVTDQLDPINIWSIGNGLSALLDGYRNQDVAMTLAHPLEPAEYALLQRLVREHGALVMGFAAARDLIERADQFALNTQILRELQPAGMKLLNELTDNGQLVAPETRRIHRPIREAVGVTGWHVGRSGYTSYVTVRNAVAAIARLTIGSEHTILNWFGTASVLAAAQSTSEVAVLAEGARMLQNYGPTITQFFAHSPEFLEYMRTSMGILEQDRQLRDRYGLE